MTSDPSAPVAAATTSGGPAVLGSESEVSPDTPRGLAFAVIGWMAAHHGHPFTASAVAARVPTDFAAHDRGALIRGLGAVGLRARTVERDLARLDPAVFPVIAITRKGQPLIVAGRAEGRRMWRIVDPSEGAHAQDIGQRALRRRLSGPLILAAPEGDGAPRLSTDPGGRARHWFWGPFWGGWDAWAQVILAVLVVNLLNLALPLFVMNVYDRVIPNLAFVTLTTLAIGVGIAIALDFCVRMIRSVVLERVTRRVDLRVGAALFRQAMSVELLSRPGGAAGIASTIRDFDTVRDFFASASFVAVIDLAFVGIFLGVLWYIVGPLALVPALAVPVVLLLGLIAQMPMRRSVDKGQAVATRRHTVLVESLMGIGTIKSLGAEPAMQREWESAVAASARLGGQTRFWSNVALNGTQLVQQAVSVGIIVWGVFLVSDGRITIGALIAANILAGRVLAPLANIAQTLFRAHYAVRSMRAITDFMALPVEGGGAVRSAARVRQGAVELKGVKYTYPGAKVPALDGVDLSVSPGECVALVGPVGSGKTTTGMLFNGLLRPTEGVVLVDGQELSHYDPAELRAGIGYLPQDAELFTGTVRENLSIGRPGASDDDLARALWYAGMDRFVAEHPDGLGAHVGEKGNRLSGGQRQGLSLARIVLRRPRLMFLDEPTNAMDQRMEATVTERLRTLHTEGLGLVLCTHRQSLAAIAPRLVVFDRGRKLLDGPYAEVVQRLQGAAKSIEAQ
ncbi:type I secretion system permease/ATPase [Anianabacter salinae]|uniref:type I secretion system permease/ATPase n=1 Tax=Anianabacter salinae TaxID=2851023 RepID=UPI00225E41A3|nr:type I secretion system permease/ATPase [Anianabacter salinae]MBV0911768.1 type I secretion system permease/ATPase [Anianabacter salinae]